MLTAIAMFVLTAGSVSAQTTPAKSSSGNAEQALRAAHQQLVEASRTGDKDAARRLMADEMTWVNIQGRVASREELLEGSPIPPREISIDRIRTFGDSAVVTGSAQLENGQRVRFLQHWVNRDGGWRLAAHQGTEVAPSPAPDESAPPPVTGTAGRSAMRSSTPSLHSDEERAVWKAQGELQRAFLEGDTAAYARLTADDYIRVAAGGDQQDKSQFLQTVKANANRPGGQLDTGDAQIVVTGDTARLVMTTWGTLPGGEAVPPARVTRVFVKHDGHWQQAAAIFTAVVQQ